MSKIEQQFYRADEPIRWRSDWTKNQNEERNLVLIGALASQHHKNSESQDLWWCFLYIHFRILW